jgi:hypothetical protein
MTYDQYLDEVKRIWSSTAHPEWRMGQTYFNVLYAIRPDLANRIRGSSLDPFYFDDRIYEFLAWTSRHLDAA